MITKEAARAERFGHELSLIMLDIDDFKQINDTYGHLQGDEVLRMVGRVLQTESRGVDEPARYGGEEFAVALPETGRGRAGACGADPRPDRGRAGPAGRRCGIAEGDRERRGGLHARLGERRARR